MLFANSVDPDQTASSAASDLGLHRLPITLLGVSRLQWVNRSSGLGTRVKDIFFYFTHTNSDKLELLYCYAPER